jgi:hypothetical protein
MPGSTRRLSQVARALSPLPPPEAQPLARASIDDRRPEGGAGRPLPPCPQDAAGFRAHFEAHGWAVARGVLRPADLSPARAAIDAAIGDQARAWRAAGLLSSLHAAEPFERRLAAIAEELPDAVFGDAASADPAMKAPGTLAALARSLDIMEARLPAVFELITNPRLLDALAVLLGPELQLSPIQHMRPYVAAREPGARQPWPLHEWHQV